MTISKELKKKISIYSILYDEAYKLYSTERDNSNTYNEDLVMEDRKFWTEKGHVNPDINFEILKNGKENVLFFELCIDKRAVSHFCFQIVPLGKGRMVGYLFWLYTLEEARNKGITQYFLSRVLSTIQKHFIKEKIGLRVSQNNQVMIHIIEKLGFEKGPTEIEVGDDGVNEPEYEYILTKPVIRCI